MKTYYLIIFNNQGREVSRVKSPRFILESYRYAWASILFRRRRKNDKNCDHWDFLTEES